MVAAWLLADQYTQLWAMLDKWSKRIGGGDFTLAEGCKMANSINNTLQHPQQLSLYLHNPLRLAKVLAVSEGVKDRDPQF